MSKNPCIKESVGFFGGKYETTEHDWEIWKDDGEYYRMCNKCKEKQVLFSVRRGMDGHSFEDWRKAK